MKESYSIEEAARFSQSSIWTIHRRIQKGMLKAFHAGGGRNLRIDHFELLRFLSQNGIPLPKELELRDRILIVDDDEKVVRSLVRYLSNNTRFEIETASSGFKAGLLIHNFRPKILILDIMLGDLNGIDVIKTIRQDSETRDLKVIAISGYIKQEQVAELLACGFDHFLAKPFKLSELMKLIHSLISSL